jgi:hypothetical protein
MLQLMMLTVAIGHPADPSRITSADPSRIEQRVTDLERRVRQLEGQLYALTDPKNRVQTTPTPTVVPPGHHAHVKQDGTVIVHGNENMGNHEAHAGIAYPYVRIAEAGQPVPTSQTQSYNYQSTYSYQSSSCPNGVCPQRRGPLGILPRR